MGQIVKLRRSIDLVAKDDQRHDKTETIVQSVLNQVKQSLKLFWTLKVLTYHFLRFTHDNDTIFRVNMPDIFMRRHIFSGKDVTILHKWVCCISIMRQAHPKEIGITLQHWSL